METTTKPTKYLHDFVNTKSANDDDVAVIYDGGTGLLEILTYGELDEFSSLVTSYIESIIKTTNFFGIICSQGLNLPPVLLGILRAGLCYYCFDHRLDLEDSKSVIDTLGIDYVIVDDDWLNHIGESSNVKFFEIQRLFMKTSSVSVLKIDRIPFTEKSKLRWELFTLAYASRTSGTTGKRKIVLVPHSSISPNVEDFIRIENVNQHDLIFGASPPTFDPFNVDLFTALGSHARILFVADSVKLNPKELCRMLISHGVTIMHCTPSLLLRFGEIEAARLFESNGPLRVLALGGERCLEKDHLRKLISLRKRSNLMLLNMYGTTEVSCWASVEIIDLEQDTLISVGESLSETDVRLFENDYRNQIYIGSRTRTCTVLNECGSLQLPIVVDDITYRETGDLGEVSDKLIIFNGRLDRMIKRHGHFVNLTDIENRVLLSNLLSLSATFYYFGKIFLIVKFKTDIDSFDLDSSKLKFGKCLEKYLPIHYYPDKIIVISDDVPVTGNGKLDVNYIRKVVMAELEDGQANTDASNNLKIHYPPEDVDEFILTTWKNNTGNRRDFDSSDSFFEAGGNSARAVRFVEEIMQGLLKFGTQIHADEELQFLNTLNRCSFGVVRKYIFKSICEEKPHIVQVAPLNTLTEIEIEKKLIPINDWVEPLFRRVPLSAITTIEKKLEDVDLTLEMPIVSREWTIDLLGCVDATPVILSNKNFRCKGIITLVGSHSGYITAVNLEVLRETRISDADSCILWRKKFPDRIATTAGVHSSQRFVFIVCCDETLYTICVETGAIRWLLHLNGLTRSTPTCSDDGKTVYVLSSFPNGQLTAINFEDGVKLWSTTLSFVTAPFSITVINSGILVTTADVSIVKIDFKGGYLSFRGEIERTCTPPVPLYLPERTLLLIASLKGLVVAFDEDLSEEIWTYQGPGDPVNPPLFHHCDIHRGLVIFATHNGIIRILDAETGILKHKLKLRIESRSTPVCYTNLKVAQVGNSESVRICCVILTDVVGGLHFLNIDTCKKVGVIQPNQTMECFSSAVICGDLVAFGGRSNKLHVLQLKDVNRPL